MAVNYTTLLGLAKPQSGTEDGTWGDIVNDQITDLVDSAIAGAATIDVTAGNVTLTDNDGAADEARAAILLVTGTPGTSRNIVAPSRSKTYVVINGSDGSVVIKGSATTGVTLAAGAKGVVSWNGSDFVQVGREGTVTSVSGTGTVNGITLTGTVTSSGNLTLGGTLSNVNLASQVTGTLPVANGGTGQTSYTNGQLLIGNTTGNTLTKATLTQGTGITITNGPGTITIASTGGGTGDVTGPASSTTNEVPVFGSGTGKAITNSGFLLTGNADSNLILGNNITVKAGSDNSVIIGSGITDPNYATEQSVIVGRSITTGYQGNTCIGYNLNNSEGSGNIVIGYAAGIASPGEYAEVVIGESATGKGSTTGFYDGSGGVYNGANTANWATTSDQRIKRNIVDSPKGLAEINQLQVRNFQYRLQEDMPKNDRGEYVVKKLDSEKIQTGFIAQEIQQIFPETVKTDGTGLLSVTVDPVIYALVNAVKELSAQVNALKAEVAVLKGN